MVPQLETMRLVLRPLELADAEQIQRLFPHWEIVKHLAAVVPWPYPADGALTFVRDVALPAVARGEQSNWTLRLKTNPEQLIGSIALIHSPSRPHENRGFWIGLPWHGRGLMTEAADAVTDYWFNVLKFSVLRISKAAANLASRRVSEKQGMRLVGTEEREYVAGHMTAEIWEITADEWNRRRGR